MYMGETKLHVLLSIGADASNKYPCHGTHHSKTLKDGWAKYIPNFALK